MATSFRPSNIGPGPYVDHSDWHRASHGIRFEWVQDETRQAPFYQDLGLIQTGVLADGRGVYDGAEDYWLTNTGKGNALSKEE